MLEVDTDASDVDEETAEEYFEENAPSEAADAFKARRPLSRFSSFPSSGAHVTTSSRSCKRKQKQVAVVLLTCRPLASPPSLLCPHWPRTMKWTMMFLLLLLYPLKKR